MIAILRTTAATAHIYGDYVVTARVDGAEIVHSVVFADQSGVKVDCGDGRVVAISWPELYAAAAQSDEISIVYRSILELATQRRAHYEDAAAHAKLLSDALSGRTTIYVSAEQDSTNVMWVSTIRAGNDGLASAQPLMLQGHPSRIYGAGDGGQHATFLLAMLEAADLAQQIRTKFASARVVEVP